MELGGWEWRKRIVLSVCFNSNVSHQHQPLHQVRIIFKYDIQYFCLHEKFMCMINS